MVLAQKDMSRLQRAYFPRGHYVKSLYGIRINSTILYQIEKSGNEYDLEENYRIPYV